jgi:hypothetical protein
MAVKIKVAGKSTAKADTPAKRSTRTTRATAKPATKRTTTKRATTKTAAAPAKRAPGRPRKDGSAPVRRSRANSNMDERTMKRHLTAVEKAGVARKKAELAHKAAVDNLHRVASEAMDAGVPMARVADVSGISRQWLYKMGEFAGRSNGDTKPAATTRTRKTSSNGKSTAKSTGAKATTRPTTRGTRSSRKIAVRSK